MKKSKSKLTVNDLTLGAMLAALSIVIGIVCKNYLNFGNGLFRITFENFPIILSGIMFGPLVGSLVGLSADIISYVLSTQTLAISPLVTLGAGSIGLISGLVSHYLYKKNGYLRLILSAFSAHLIGSLLIKSFALFTYYGWAILWRIPTYVLIATLEILLICFLYNRHFFKKWMWKKGDKK